MDFSYIYIAVIVLGGIAVVSASVLYVCSKKFAVVEDERIGQIQSLLPQANCGGCGYAGCSGFASALVKSADNGSIGDMLCTVGGDDVMARIADVLGVKAAAAEPKVAVVRCGGTCEMRPKAVQYDGLQSCAAMSMSGTGEAACGYGCLGEGDCVAACGFGAIRINPLTGIAEVDEDKCGACGACASACPRHVIEIRNKGARNRRVYVGCVNKDKGAAAAKMCAASCIGCGRCEKECAFGAITVASNLAYIDYSKCKLCRKCEKACARKAIKAVNFPERKAAVPVGETAAERPQT